MGTGPQAQPSETPPSPPKPRKKRTSFRKRLFARAENLILEGFGTAIAVLLIAGTDRLVSWSIGDGKFFDYIPVRWIFDAAHIVVVGRLIWGVIKKFNDDDEET